MRDIVSRISRMEEDIRRLKLRLTGGAVGPVLDLSPYLYGEGSGGTFRGFEPYEGAVESDGGIAAGYYIHNGRCYLTGAVKYTAYDSYPADRLFLDAPDGLPVAAYPHNGLQWVRFFYDSDGTHIFGTSHGDWSPTTSREAEGASVPGRVVGSTGAGVQIFFGDTLLPHPGTGYGADAGTPELWRWLLDEGVIDLAGISWRIA